MTKPPRGFNASKIGGLPPLESPVDFSKIRSSSINKPVMEVTVAGLNPVKCAISALEIGP
jgi:hypothetical protein